MEQLPPLPVPEDQLTDLARRLSDTRWGADWPEEPWVAGTDSSTLRRLVDRWTNGFDWRAVERRLLALPSVHVDLNGVPVHAFVFASEVPGGFPILLTNGWPSTSVELIELAQRLSTPSQFGGDARDAFTVVVPSLPGFPFSPQRPGRASNIHELWHRLMGELGYHRYGAHGGDLGAGITSRLAQAYPTAVVGIHLLAVAGQSDVDVSTLTDAERHYLEAGEQWSEHEGSYQHQQQRRPLTLAPGLSDSPVGLLAWIVEKYRAWSDSNGDLSSRFSDDFLLTQASLYWFTNSISTSFRPYYEYAAGLTPAIHRVDVPTAVAVFPRDLAQPPREWAERTYNVTRYTTMPRGGHFAPHEEPDLLATDIRQFFLALQQ